MSPAAGLLEAFTARAERAAARVHACDDVVAAASLISSLAGGGPLCVSPTAAVRYADLLAALHPEIEVFSPKDAVDAARARVGLSAGEALVAETGSVLVAEHVLEDRLVSMLATVLVQVVPVNAVVASLDDVAVWLAREAAGGRAGYHALVTGPSRSADIERSLTVGVQGPAELHVLVLGGAGAEAS